VEGGEPAVDMDGWIRGSVDAAKAYKMAKRIESEEFPDVRNVAIPFNIYENIRSKTGNIFRDFITSYKPIQQPPLSFSSLLFLSFHKLNSAFPINPPSQTILAPLPSYMQP
jgi:hypothetical protein